MRRIAFGMVEHRPRGAETGSGNLDGAFVLRWVREGARSIGEQRDYLTQLDAAIGDADHGVNMDRGFAAVVERLEQLDDAGPAEMFEAAGTTLVLAVGGAAGPLYGSALRHMGRAADGVEPFDGEALLVCLRAALEEIQRLGAAEVGDKTIVDALAPAVHAFERGLRAGDDLAVVAARARSVRAPNSASTT